MTPRDEIKDLLHEDEVEPEALEEEEPSPGELDEEVLLEVLEVVTVDEEAVDDDEAEAGAPAEVVTVDEEDEDDVEASLDDILRAKLAAGEDEDDEGLDDEDAVAVPVYVVDDEELHPHGPDEFVCQVCFVIHHKRMLADPDKLVCVDCA